MNLATARRCAVWLSLALGLLRLGDRPAQATIVGTYVDAEALSGLANITPTSAFSPTYSGSFTDSLWDDRSGVGLNSAGALAPTQNVIEVGPTSSETVPTITQTVTGLASADYNVYLLYWSVDNVDWSVRARLSGPGPFQQFDMNGQFGTPGVDTGIAVSNVHLFEAFLGNVTGSSFAVDLQNTTDGGGRTWFEGLAYVQVPEPSTALLLLVGGVVCYRRRPLRAL